MAAALTWAIGLLLVGLILIIIECMIPSFGIIGVAGIASIVASIIFSFRASANVGYLFLMLSAAGIPAAIHFGFKLLPKTPFGRGFVLNAPDSIDEPVEKNYDELEGQEGVAKTMLRPSGIAIINDDRLQVQTEGQIIETNARIRVIKVEGNKIFVEQI